MLNKLQNTIAKMKIRSLLSSNGEGTLKGLKFKEGSRSFTLGEVHLRTNIPMLEFNLDTIESFECTHREYELKLVIKDLKVTAPEGEFSVDELSINSFLELKAFALELRGVMEAMSEEKMW